jgi:hypothetical protein
MDNFLNRDNAKVGATLRFRGKRYVIDEVGAAGVWMRRARKNGTPRKDAQRRDFIYFHEAEPFGVVVE